MQANLFPRDSIWKPKKKGYPLCGIALFLIEAGTSLFLSCN